MRSLTPQVPILHALYLCPVLWARYIALRTAHTTNRARITHYTRFHARRHILCVHAYRAYSALRTRLRLVTAVAAILVAAPTLPRLVVAKHARPTQFTRAPLCDAAACRRRFLHAAHLLTCRRLAVRRAFDYRWTYHWFVVPTSSRIHLPHPAPHPTCYRTHHATASFPTTPPAPSHTTTRLLHALPHTPRSRALFGYYLPGLVYAPLVAYCSAYQPPTCWRTFPPPPRVTPTAAARLPDDALHATAHHLRTARLYAFGFIATQTTHLHIHIATTPHLPPHIPHTPLDTCGSMRQAAGCPACPSGLLFSSYGKGRLDVAGREGQGKHQKELRYPIACQPLATAPPLTRRTINDAFF